MVLMFSIGIYILPSYLQTAIYFVHCDLSLIILFFPDKFGLTEMKKGYFPHLANKLANQKYVGPYFLVDMYNPG